MKTLVALAVAVCAVGVCSAMRAFPIESREYAERLFQGANPRLVWDETNYLVDVSGRYAHCKYINQDGPFQVDAKFNEQGRLGGLRDTYPGEEAHWGAVMAYLEQALPEWLTDPTYRSQITAAERFGCSVQPGCRDRDRRSRYMSIACVFSPGYDGQGEEPVVPDAYAFTPQQYRLTEQILGISWDRTFYLENLSGTDIDCSMIGRTLYPLKANYRGKGNSKNRVQEREQYGLVGSAQNVGSTESAMVEVLNGWSQGQGRKLRRYNNIEVGCSLIPDCMLGNQMWVVVTCLYSYS